MIQVVQLEFNVSSCSTKFQLPFKDFVPTLEMLLVDYGDGESMDADIGMYLFLPYCRLVAAYTAVP